ncbi:MULTISPECIES: hypothetical protein [unclassified Paenibacillus]|uniref:hypothetical protein n=1 Tax=unclassified Paenibacillus TaxID=185978 RepID=UPI002405CF0E|nr:MULTISPECIES: hypothetical protein [unclassified Paenibacillus]MDF9845146.1 hypothetical protein [Paenibacillus sp. PastF-2]MDF9851745.1 hypothetical protein [Paenibacillus sp. PastM-2]MDF9858302.1 hypothetical protein [Paenibacillus sp. PastF-1]MDH6483618.1 hypothetical protein [Paenibacillus sp. PastH-2]MDH6510977.1 hypothetical protein [Paenibacillus sp. PastM-3]
MAAIVLLFLLIFLFEGVYLKVKKRKLRTYIIVYGIMLLALVYNLASALLPEVLNPNLIIEAVLGK